MTPLLLTLALAAPPADGAEFGKMLGAILGGSKMGPGEGWFGPARKRHDWAWLAGLHGVPADGAIRQKDFKGPPASFTALDRDGNAALTADDFDWADDGPYGRQMSLVQRLLRQADADKSGTLDADEWQALFERRAADDRLTPEGLRRVLFPPQSPPAGRPSGFSVPSDEPSTRTLLRGLVASEIGSGHPGPAVGSPAPDFTLRTADGSRTVTLSKLVGPKPVVLVFGNFSCGPFRNQYAAVEELKAKFAGRAEFLGVYVREAHPTDGWRMASNDMRGVKVAQPRTLGDRAAVAGRCSAALKMSLPLVVDALDDTAGHAYSGMPSRLYLIDRAGTVAYQSGRGPFGFKVGELEQALHLLAVEEQAAEPKADADLLPMLSDAAAWDRLPAGTGKAGPLPGWARTLAGPLPRTVAAMLELEQAVRGATPPVEPKLAAKVRWAAGRASGSRYGEAAGLADLRRAGGTPAEIAALQGDWDALPAAERMTLRFARKLTEMGSSVTDAEFEAVRKLHGDAGAVGVVLVVAYSNFLDRLVLALGTPAADAELPPPAVAFAKPYTGGTAPARVLPTDPPAGPPARVTDPDWLDTGAESLRRSMAAQTARPPRVPVPTFEDLKAKMPPNTFAPGQTVKVRWSLTVRGYQPAVGVAWLNCLRTFEAEAKQDRRFEESLFWVVTRSVDCFY